jgi:cytoskeletal protein RodZ
MAEPEKASAEPTWTRLIVSAIIVVLVVILVWKVIDYRQQPPPPPGQKSEIRNSKFGANPKG